MSGQEKDFHKEGWHRAGYAPLRWLWLAFRGVAVRVLGPERLDRVLWSVGFFHAKSRWFRYEASTPDGCKVLVRPPERTIIKEIYEDRLYADAKISEAGTVVDCGAHIGLFAVHAAKRCPKGKVVAVEPSPLNLELLRENIERNGLENVTIHPWALAGRTGKGEIHFSSEYASDYVISPVIGKATSMTLPVEFHTLDELFEREAIDACQLLKVDIEGSELEAFKSGRRALAVSSQLLLEIHLR
ncbi:FkbM family methyltransferase [Elusimicrobiota bacterium]